MIYFTSDLHFGHKNAITFTNRPFADVEEMDQKLIENWNKKVHANDEVYILGDLTMKGPQYAQDILSQLKGRKYLVRGNHDNFVDGRDFETWRFEWIKDYYRMNYMNNRIILCHYPFAEWDCARHGSLHLHGHIHSSPEYNLAQREAGMFRYDVGVDANNYAPVSLKEIEAFFECVENGWPAHTDRDGNPT